MGKKFPLLAIVVVLYNILVLGVGRPGATPLLTIPLPSGAQWPFSTDDLCISLGLVFLFFEVIKSTRTSTASIIDHALSTLLFTICVVEFAVVQRLGTSTFFFLCVMCAIDVVAGFTVTITSARRDYGPG